MLSIISSSLFSYYKLLSNYFVFDSPTYSALFEADLQSGW